MREYKRATRECSFSEFPSAIVAAVRILAEMNDFGDIEGDALICAETSSEKINQGFFSKIFGGANYAVKTCVVVTPDRILWATLDKKNGTAVLSARLRDVEIKDFQSNLIEDTGLEIFGWADGFTEGATIFIGLGEDGAAQKLRQVLKKAVADARP
jgi:hypothetical protein